MEDSDMSYISEDMKKALEDWRQIQEQLLRETVKKEQEQEQKSKTKVTIILPTETL